MRMKNHQAVVRAVSGALFLPRMADNPIMLIVREQRRLDVAQPWTSLQTIDLVTNLRQQRNVGCSRVLDTASTNNLPVSDLLEMVK
jgi:hypothetical protein